MHTSGIEARPTGRSVPAFVTLAVVVAAVSVVVTVAGTPRHPLWGDEVASARVISEDGFGDVLSHVRRSESTPPAWYVLAWGTSKADAALTGGALFTPVERLRLLSVLFAAAAAVLTALWALSLIGDVLPASLAGLLVACGSAPAIYAGQLRAYGLLTFLAVAFGMLLVRSSLRPARWPLVALALGTWLGLMTHYFFGFTVAAGALWLWTSRPRPPGRRSATVALAFGLLGFLPWVASFLQQARQERYAWLGSFDARHVVLLPGSLFFGPEGVLFGVARLVLCIAVVVGVVVLWRRPEGRAIVALALLPILGAGAIWLTGQPIFDERNLLVVAPFVAILAAASLLALPKLAARGVAVAGLVAVVLATVVAQATLGWIAYDRIAGALVELGWNRDEPVFVTGPTGRTSLRVSVGWYLPGHPALVPAAGSRRRCPARFVIGQSATLGPWLARHHVQAATREFASYDHPFRGRPNGHILVVRLARPIDLAGAARLYVRAPGWRCPTRLVPR